MRRWIGLLALCACGATDLSDVQEALCAECAQTCVYDEPVVGGAAHVDGPVDYPESPPAGGDHDGCWTTWGVHEVDPGAEHWVHNLEHGGVVFLYDCPDGCPSEAEALEGLVGELPVGTAILAPYAGMETRFAAVAWGRRLRIECLDLDALTSFYQRFVDQGPESVSAAPPGGCMETGSTSG